MAGSAMLAVKVVSGLLLAYEAGSINQARKKGPPAFRVCEKLREPLMKLMGSSGFRSLLSRAATIAAKQSPWLSALSIAPDGTVKIPDESLRTLSRRALEKGEAALTAEFLGLIATFIGPPLTMRLLHDIWPNSEEIGF